MKQKINPDGYVKPAGPYTNVIKVSSPQEMYRSDGQHASEAGSEFAAKYIWEEIYSDLMRKK